MNTAMKSNVEPLLQGSPQRGFWDLLWRPIVGLSPMDGVTNHVFRYMTAKYGPPDVTFTEFVPVEGIMHKGLGLLQDFRYDEIERPVVAQVYGLDPGAFYAVAHLLCELGFDGIDINMGCPARKVANRGAGAGLIQTPGLAKEIIRAVQRGVRDWCNGQNASDVGIPSVIIKTAAQMMAGSYAPCAIRPAHTEQDGAYRTAHGAPRTPLPVSVKTRIGYDRVVVTDWVRHLLDVEPAAISIHGRTLQQLYRGAADWEAIAAAAEIIRPTNTLVLGNGDILSSDDVIPRIRDAKVDGVLIGRGAMGNPWIFQGDSRPGPHEVLRVMIEYAYRHQETCGPRAFGMVKRLVKPFTQGYANAAPLRQALLHAQDAQAMDQIVQSYLTGMESESATFSAPTSAVGGSVSSGVIARSER